MGLAAPAQGRCCWVGACEAIWAPAGAVVPLGRTLRAASRRSGCVSLDAVWYSGCAWRGQMEVCVP